MNLFNKDMKLIAIRQQIKLISEELENTYTKDESVKREDVYNKDELYCKIETYSKEEIDLKIKDLYELINKEMNIKYYIKSDLYKKLEVYNRNEIDDFLSKKKNKTDK